MAIIYDQDGLEEISGELNLDRSLGTSFNYSPFGEIVQDNVSEEGKPVRLFMIH
jgi:hypothetical protein